MSKKSPMKPLVIALGATFATSLAGTPVANAAENPFAMSDLSSGYLVAEGGEGKCGGAHKATKEGNCGAGKKAADEGMMKKGETMMQEGATEEGAGMMEEGKGMMEEGAGMMEEGKGMMKEGEGM